jgi:hypothetical protein
LSTLWTLSFLGETRHFSWVRRVRTTLGSMQPPVRLALGCFPCE